MGDYFYLLLVWVMSYKLPMTLIFSRVLQVGLLGATLAGAAACDSHEPTQLQPQGPVVTQPSLPTASPESRDQELTATPEWPVPMAADLKVGFECGFPEKGSVKSSTKFQLSFVVGAGLYVISTHQDDDPVVRKMKPIFFYPRITEFEAPGSSQPSLYEVTVVNHPDGIYLHEHVGLSSPYTAECKRVE